MPAGAGLTALLQRLAKALDDLGPDLPPGREAAILVIDPLDPNHTIVVGQSVETLLDHLGALACDPGKEIGIARVDRADLKPAAKVN